MKDWKDRPPREKRAQAIRRQIWQARWALARSYLHLIVQAGRIGIMCVAFYGLLHNSPVPNWAQWLVLFMVLGIDGAHGRKPK